MRATALVCALLAAVAPVLAYGAPAADDRTAAAKSRIESMQSQLASAMSSFDAASGRLDVTRAQIAENRARLDAITASVKEGENRLSAEANFLYRTDGNGFTEALLTAPSLDVFATRLMALTRIASRDAELIGKLKRDRAVAERLSVLLAERERTQEAQLAQVRQRRSRAQAALEAQQRYVDSLAPSVAKALQAQTSDSGPKRPTRPPVDRLALAWAKVEGRGGRYRVLVHQPDTYAPTGITFTGTATWYGNVRPGMKTASGRAFNENELTCAHKSLPFGTRIAVTFRGRRVIVVVTDRGPYGKGRVIDLSKRAASVIGLKSAGVGTVRCEVVRPI